MDITELVIDRKLWMRGSYDDFKTKLFSVEKFEADGEQYMCCLGQLCLAMGMTKEHIRDRHEPFRIHRTVKGRDWFDGKDIFTDKAMLVNDDKRLSESEREAKEIDLFQDVGIALSFTGE